MSVPPDGRPVVAVMAMPRDANAGGGVFGGWLLAQMDIAGAVAAHARVRGRIVTAGADAIAFHRPVRVGDLVSFFAGVARVGRTSLTVAIEAWARRHDGAEEKVLSGRFTYVHLGADGRPAAVAPDARTGSGQP